MSSDSNAFLPHQEPAPASGDAPYWWNSSAGGKGKPGQPAGAKARTPSAGDRPPAPPKKAREGVNDDESSSDSVEFEIPLRNLQAKAPPIWTYGLMVVLILIFGAEFFQSRAFESTKLNPLLGPDWATLYLMGAKDSAAMLAGEWWRIGSAPLLQNGVISLVLTVVMLWYARTVEQDSGFWRASLLCLLTGTYGTIFGALLVPSALSCGTTGVVCGIIALMFVDLSTSWRGQEHPVRKLVILIVGSVLVIVLGLTPFVDQWGHIGGAIMGVFFALMFLPNLSFGKCERQIHGAVAFLSFPVMSAGFMITLIIFFRRLDAGGEICKGCYKITCIKVANWCDNLTYKGQPVQVKT